MEKELEILKAPGGQITPEIHQFEAKLKDLKTAYAKANDAYKELEAEKNKFKVLGKVGAVAGTAAQTLTTVLSVEKASKVINDDKASFGDKASAIGDVAINVEKNIGQVAGIVDKFKNNVAAKKLSNTLAAVGSTYDAVKAWNNKDAPLSKKLDKTAMALLDTSAAVSSFAVDAKAIAAGTASKFGKFATKFAPLEGAVASKFGYGIFAVVSLKRAYEAHNDPNMSPQAKRNAYINAGLDVATGVAILAGATTVGHVVLAAKIGYELYNFADEKFHISEKVANAASKAANYVGEEFNKFNDSLNQTMNELQAEVTREAKKFIGDVKQVAGEVYAAASKLGKEVINGAKEELGRIADGAKKAVNDLSKKAVEFGNNVKDGAIRTYHNAAEVVTKTAHRISEKAVETGKNIVNAAKQEIRDISNGAKRAVDNIGKKAVELGNRIENGAKEVMASVSQKATETKAKIENTAKNVVNEVSKTVTDVSHKIDNAKQALGDSFSKARDKASSWASSFFSRKPQSA